MMIDALQNLKNWADKEKVRSIHDASEVVKRIAGVTDKRLVDNVHVTRDDLNILLGVDTLKRQQLVDDEIIPKPEFPYYGHWSVRQVREIIANGIEDKAA